MVSPAQQMASLPVATSWVNANPEAIALLDLSTPEARAVWLNPAMETLVGETQATASLKPHAEPIRLAHLLGIDEGTQAWRNLMTALASGLSSRLQCRAYRQQREAFWADISAYMLPRVQPAEAATNLAIVTVRDLSTSWLAEKALNLQNRRNAALLNEVTDAVLQVDCALVLNTLNPAAETLTGWTEDLAKGRPVADVVQLIDNQTGAALSNPLLGAMLTGESADWTGNAAVRRTDGSQIPVIYRTAVIRDDEGLIHDGLLMLRNANEATVMASAMAHLAWHDALTDLPNRHVFDDRLAQATALARRHNHSCAMLLIDLPHHKNTVETAGQVAADDLLQALAVHLPSTFRGSDTVCFLGDARFAVVLPLVTPTATANQLKTKALSVTGKLANEQTTECEVGLKVGVAIFPQDGATVAELIAKARAQL